MMESNQDYERLVPPMKRGLTWEWQCICFAILGVILVTMFGFLIGLGVNLATCKVDRSLDVAESEYNCALKINNVIKREITGKQFCVDFLADTIGSKMRVGESMVISSNDKNQIILLDCWVGQCFIIGTNVTASGIIAFTPSPINTPHAIYEYFSNHVRCKIL